MLASSGFDRFGRFVRSTRTEGARVAVLLTAAGTLAALAPACSSNAQVTPQAGVVWTVEAGANSAADCPVGGSDTWTIGGGGTDDSTVGDQGSTNGVPVGVSCTVSGSDSSGYNVFVSATYGTNLGTLTVQGHVAGSKDPQPNITAAFNDNLPRGMTANLTSGACTITYPNQNMGVASGRIWAHVDCPAATDANRGRKCDANADFRFENCGQ